MCNPIGTNKAYIDQSLYLRNKIGEFGKGEEGKKAALKKAENTEGSELVYENKNGNWQVDSLQEKGYIPYVNDKSFSALKSTDKADIEFNAKAMSDNGIKQFVISFADDRSPNLQVAHDDNEQASVLLAGRKDIDPNVMLELAKSKHSNVLNILAKRTDLPENIMMQLSKSKDSTVLSILVTNPSSSFNVLRTIASKDIKEVSAMLVSNEKAMSDDIIQKTLAKSEHSQIKIAVTSYLERKPN
ncbi:MAG: hypothetical protein U0354_01735 [Candidatus Sericytochromatia bacterium]